MWRGTLVKFEGVIRAGIGLIFTLALLGQVSVGDALGAGLWSEAVLVGDDDDHDCTAPGVALTSDGVILVVWSAIDPQELDSEIAFVTILDAVQSEQRLLHEPNSGMDRVAFVSAGSDRVPWVIWERYGDGYEQVVSHWDGANWTSPKTVFSGGGRYDWYGIHASNAGNVWVARDSRTDESDRDVFVRNWDGYEWGAVEQLGFPGFDDEDPVMVVNEDGNAVVAWLSDYPAGSPSRVYAAVRNAEGWSTPAVVDTSPGNIVMCDMELLPDGRPIVAWTGNGYTTSTDIEYAILEDGSWELKGLVNEADVEGVDDDKWARLARNSSGDLWAVWGASVIGAPTKEIRASKWMGDGWSREELVSAPDTMHLAYDGQAQVAVAEDGVVWAVWGRMQEEFPWDKDAYVAFRRHPEPEGVWAMSAHASGDTALISWRASGAWVHDGFHVWRMAANESTGWNSPQKLPVGATRISSTPVSGCSVCRFADDLAEPGEIYHYWIRGERGGLTLGPVELSIPRDGGSLAAIIGVRPNPAHDGVSFDISWSGGGGVSLSVYTAGGKLVRRWPVAQAGGSEPATEVIYWDGTDSSGRRVPSGVYFAMLSENTNPLRRSARAVVVLR